MVPESEGRRTNSPPWAAATCLTTRRPWPRRRRPVRRAISSVGVSWRKPGREPRPESAHVYPQATAAGAGFDDYAGTTVLDRVDDKIVERLGEQVAIGAHQQLARVPSQLQRPARQRRPAPPARHRRFQQRPGLERLNRARCRLAVDLPLEPLQSSRRHLQDHRWFGAPALGCAQRQGLERAAQLVQGLVERRAPPPSPQTADGRRCERGRKRPAGRDLCKREGNLYTACLAMIRMAG